MNIQGALHLSELTGAIHVAGVEGKWERSGTEGVCITAWGWEETGWAEDPKEGRVTVVLPWEAGWRDLNGNLRWRKRIRPHPSLPFSDSWNPSQRTRTKKSGI